MCLGIPGQVTELVDPAEHLAKVEVNGVRRIVSVRLLAGQGLEVGDWVLVHVGFAMARIDEEEARSTIDQVKKMGREYLDELDAFTSTRIV